MAYYRLYPVDSDHFSGVSDFEAHDDADAIRHALTLSGTATAELWCGTRKIEQFKSAAADFTAKKK